MTLRRRLVAITFVVTALIVGAVWGPFVIQGFLLPLSTAVWELLRIFVLSVDQRIYWLLGLLVAVNFLVFRLGQRASVSELPPVQDPDFKPAALTHWKALFSSARMGYPCDKHLRRELKWILVRIYASKHRLPAGFQVAERFQKREVALPDYVYHPLFSEPPKTGGSPFVRLAAWVKRKQKANGWNRKLTEKNLAEILSYFEQMMESNDV